MKRMLIILPALCLCCSCAVFEPENRHLVPWVEDHLVPVETSARILAAPLWVPAGVAAGVLDAFVVHPITVVDEAYDDVHDVLWEEWPEGYVMRWGSVPYRALASPLVFGVSFAGRAVFDIGGK